MSSTAPPVLSTEELALFNEFFSSHFGLYFSEHKREILESRLLPRLRANRVQRFIDYYLLLQYDLERELDSLTQAITNNESYFFRETGQFEVLDRDLLYELESHGISRQLRFLSAGCSSGEEPYTLNIYLREISGHIPADLRIDAFDLDQERLALARRGLYRSSSLRALDESQIGRYFTAIDARNYELRGPYRRGVRFSFGNILDVTTFPPGVKYDVIFCRNVLIYFSETALKTAIDNFAKVIRHDGLLFLGHSESIIGLSKAFQAERLGQCIVYRRTHP